MQTSIAFLHDCAADTYCIIRVSSLYIWLSLARQCKPFPQGKNVLLQLNVTGRKIDVHVVRFRASKPYVLGFKHLALFGLAQGGKFLDACLHLSYKVEFNLIE